LPDTLRQKFESCCNVRSLLKRLWNGEPPPRSDDDSPSAYVFALAGHLRGLGFTPFEFVQFVNVWDFQSEKHLHDFERYVSRAWNNNKTPLGPSGMRDETENLKPARPKLYSLAYGAAADLALTDSIEPLILGLLDRSAMSVWYGDSNTGKTFVVLDAAWHIAAGRAWGGNGS
jgi:hypothetical protein